jgi:glycosyltransferase involved in cell wall biosynthesis
VKTLPISVCIISGAEAQRIGRALESVAGWTAETMVVLNQEVQDGTEEICVRHGAKVFREPWKGHIAQKNSAAAKATQEWILGIDADEAVTPELREEIAATLEREARSAQHVAYSFPRLVFYCGRWIRHGDWYPGRGVRLWRRGQAEWGGVDPHDELQVQGTIGKLHQNLLHYTMETINHQIAKTVKYADNFVEHRLKEKKSITVFDLLVRPVWRFWRGYLFRLGFLDGWQGFTIAWLTAFYTFLRYVKVREAELPKETRE